jgi:hypothetical protein
MNKKSKHAGLAEQNGFDPAFLSKGASKGHSKA